jgi:hypothetical protein
MMHITKNMTINPTSVSTKITVSLYPAEHKNHHTWRMGFVISNSPSPVTASVPEKPFMSIWLKATVLTE